MNDVDLSLGIQIGTIMNKEQVAEGIIKEVKDRVKQELIGALLAMVEGMHQQSYLDSLSKLTVDELKELRDAAFKTFNDYVQYKGK